MNFAGREIVIVASAQSEGSLLSLLGAMRGTRSFVLRRDPGEYGIAVGSYIERDDGLMLAGKVVSISDNDDPDDWFNFTGATSWTVTISRPWKQSDLHTSLGQCRVEWMEDELFPRIGKILETPPGSHFRLGDIVRVA